MSQGYMENQIAFDIDLEDSIHYSTLSELGHGTYGKVYKVKLEKASDNTSDISSSTSSEDDQICAMKVINKSPTVAGISPSAIREKAFLASLNHPNIVKYFGSNEFEDDKMELFLEYCDGDLEKFIEIKKDDEKIYNMKTIKEFMRQILEGVSYMHSKKIMHRDLKPSNILIKGNREIKITDFGLSTVYSVPSRKLSTFVATLPYRAPELVLKKGNYNPLIDVWSIGCIFAELLLKRPLFNFTKDKCKDLDLLDQMFHIYGTFNEKMIPGLSQYPLLQENSCRKKFKHLFKGDGIKKTLLMNSDFIKDINDPALDLLEKLLEVNPYKRISCVDALKHVRFNIIILFFRASFIKDKYILFYK